MFKYEGNFEKEKLLDLCSIFMQRYNVLLNGTEILLDPEYFEALQLIGQDFIVTNGIALAKNSRLIEELMSFGIKSVGMLYHMGIHKEISSVKKEVIEENIQSLLHYGLDTYLRVTITSKNYYLLRQMCEDAIMLGAKGIKFTNFMRMG